MHFRDGYPRDQHPLPTELLSNKAPEQKNEFKGAKHGSESNEDIIETDEEVDVRLEDIYYLHKHQFVILKLHQILFSHINLELSVKLEFSL